MLESIAINHYHSSSLEFPQGKCPNLRITQPSSHNERGCHQPATEADVKW